MMNWLSISEVVCVSVAGYVVGGFCWFWIGREVGVAEAGKHWHNALRAFVQELAGMMVVVTAKQEDRFWSALECLEDVKCEVDDA